MKFLHLYISRCHGFLRDPKLALARDVIVSSATTTAAPAVGQQQAEAVETQLRCLQTVSGRQKLALRRISAALRESGMVKVKVTVILWYISKRVNLDLG